MLGEIKLDDEVYKVNEVFQQSALQIADALEIDELEAARLLLEKDVQNPLAASSALFAVVTDFHDRRECLLQSLRLILRESNDHDDEDGQRGRMQDIVLHILDVKNGPPSNGSAYTRKCITAMGDIESWQIRVGEQAQKATVLGTSLGPEILAMLHTQLSSLSKQHETLGACLYYLFQGNYTISEDLRKLLEVPKRFDRIDLALVHYLPAFWAGFAQYGSSERSISHEDAQSLHQNITAGDLKSASVSLQLFRAVLWLWWACEYSSWHHEGVVNIAQRTQSNEAEETVALAKTALNDGALTFLLSICTTMVNDEWHHPARQELVTLLVSNTSHSAPEGEPLSAPFQTLFMECLESFSESWITNMPDTIRQLKNEEDDRRLQHISVMQDGIDAKGQQDPDMRLHLECFLVLISFAFERRPDAAEEFWADPDGNLFGFLQWASKRQTVPRVSAFCEMLCSVSEGPDNASSAHRFLLDESATSSGRLRKSPSMNYGQMFAELELYAFKVNEKPSPMQSLPNIRKVLPTDMNELESPVMLSCYLRLIAHMCREAPQARLYILEHPSFNLVHTVLILCSGPVPSYLRASVFTTLESLLSAKFMAQGYWLWTTLDDWAANGVASLAPNLTRSPQSMSPPTQSLRQTLEVIGTSFDQYSAFTVLLRSLVAPPTDESQRDALPFPLDLGANYRMPGIEPYVDFVCGTLFAKRMQELPDENQIKVCRLHCLDFMATSMETFNESLVAVANQSQLMSGGDDFVADYAQRHPFSRVMGWLFNEAVVNGLIGAMQLQFDEVESLPPGAMEISSLERCLDILNTAFNFQPTYLEIIRPLIRKSGGYSPVAASAISSLEDIIASHPKMVSDLAQYVGTAHDQIVLRSLALLQKLSCSTKLNPPILSSDPKPSKSRRIVDMLGHDNNFKLVTVALAERMRTDIRELEFGPQSRGYNIKDGVLAFLNTCLAAQNDVPNVAHLFLGFTRVGDTLIVGVDSPLENGRSLCNAIIDLVENYPDGEENGFESWLVHVKTSAFQVLRQLWTSRLCSTILLKELRTISFLSSQFAKQSLISPDTLWDGLTLSHPQFWLKNSADALAEFLGYRNFLYDYAVTEMRSASCTKLISLRLQILSTLQGISRDPVDGIATAHLSIFDLFDFASIDIGRKPRLPELKTLPLPDLKSCISALSEDSGPIYDLPAVEELVELTVTRSLRDLKPGAPNEEEQLRAEAGLVLDFAKESNQWILVRMARRQALRMWVELVIVTIQCWPSDQGAKVQFALTAMQLINPMLDTYLIEQADEAIEILRLADVLVASLARVPPPDMQGRTSKVVIDRQLQLFRTCIGGIPAPDTTPTLRALFYSVCAQYLSQVKKLSDDSTKARRHSLDCVRTDGVPLITMISDDAENGQENYRLPAFVLLTLFTDLARQEKSSFVVETLVKINMLHVLLDPLKLIAFDLQEADPKGLLLSNL